MKTRHSAAHAPPAVKFIATTGRQTNADQTFAGTANSQIKGKGSNTAATYSQNVY